MPALVALADDFSGASDQAGMLARAGARSLLVLDPRYHVDPAAWDAVTIATRLRSIPVPEARRTVRRLYKLAQSLSPHMVQYKFCSTFDSTPEGNIGPCLDVAADLFSLPGTVVVPALPVNGRTTYQGTHFVLGVPLAESPMRHHPLNPMTDSNLVRWLGHQTPRRVGLIRYETVRRGPKALRACLEQLWAAGDVHVVIDCVDQRQVRTIAAAVADLPFISGSSALPMELPAFWRKQGLIAGTRPQPDRAPGTRRDLPSPVLALAGSCAAQTLRQVDYPHGFHLLRPDLTALLTSTPRQAAEALLSDVEAAFASHSRVLVATSQPPAPRADFVAKAAAAGLSARDLGLRIESMFGHLARLSVRQLGLRHLLIAGGETSGAVCQALGLQAVEILQEIAPGVPLCRALPDRDLILALKGGNFATDDFFTKAAAMASGTGAADPNGD